MQEGRLYDLNGVLGKSPYIYIQEPQGTFFANYSDPLISFTDTCRTPLLDVVWNCVPSHRSQPFHLRSQLKVLGKGCREFG